MPTPKHKAPTIEQPGKPARRPLSRLLLPASHPADIGRVPYQAYAPSVPRKPLGSGAYSGAVVGAYGLEATHRMLRP